MMFLFLIDIQRSVIMVLVSSSLINSDISILFIPIGHLNVLIEQMFVQLLYLFYDLLVCFCY